MIRNTQQKRPENRAATGLGGKRGGHQDSVAGDAASPRDRWRQNVPRYCVLLTEHEHTYAGSGCNVLREYYNVLRGYYNVYWADHKSGLRSKNPDGVAHQPACPNSRQSAVRRKVIPPQTADRSTCNCSRMDLSNRLLSAMKACVTRPPPPNAFRNSCFLLFSGCFQFC